MGTSDKEKAGNTEFSWENEGLNTSPISAQGLNSGIRSDMQAAYLRGPTQQHYVGLGPTTRDRMANLTGTAVQNRGLLTDAVNFNRDLMSRGGLNEHQVGAMDGLRGTIGGFQEIVGNRGFNSQMADGLSAQTDALRNFQGLANAGGWNDTMRGARDEYSGLLSRYGAIADSDGLNPMLRGAASDADKIGDRFMGIANSGGLTPQQRQAMSGVQTSRQRYDDLYKRGAAGNPELNNIIRQTNDNTYADVMASLGSTGAVGSNIHMDELGGALADNESRLRYQDFGDSFSRQGAALAGAMGADESLFGMGQTGMGNTQSALSGALGAQGLVSGIGQFGAGNVNNALAGMAGANAGIAGLGTQAYNNLQNAVSGIGSTGNNIAQLGQQAMGNMTGAMSGIQNANTGIFNMGQTGVANAANASGQLPGLYDAMMTPDRIAVAEQAAYDADRQQQAAFDPYLNHIAQYQGLLGANSAGPQPAGLMDYLKLIGGTAAAIF